MNPSSHPNDPKAEHAGGVQQIRALLIRYPHAVVRSEEDAKCKAFLNELGMLPLFHHSTEPNLSALLCTDHPTHWVIGRLWSGYPLPHQNGYAVECLPKTVFPESAARNLKQHLLEQYGGHSQEDRDILVPPDWREQN